MGVIEDVFEDVEADVALEEFREAVEDKVEQMGGLADEETAAMLIAHELADQEVSGVSDVEPGMDEVKFLAKVLSVGERRTFERDGDQEDGRVVNVEVADESGQIRVSFWDDQADAAVEELEVGQVLRIAGRPKDGYNGVEVNADRVEVADDEEIDIQIMDTYRVEDLSMGLSDVTLRGKVLDTDSVRTFDRDDGSEGRVANLTLGDPTGRIRITLWDEKADLATEFSAGESVEVVDGYVRERDGSLELHVGNRGAVERIDEAVEYVPETTDIADLELGQNADLAGGVIELDPVRTFDRDDGSEGQVRNVRIKDETGEIRVALWGDKADTDVDLGDYVVVADVQIKDGWQDDLEASANWRSTVTILDDDPRTGADESAAASGASTDSDGQSRGLSAFESGGSSESKTPPSDTGTAGGEAAGGSGGAATALADSADAGGSTIEFTGRVVQTGSPVVLDDGDTTYSVDTDAGLRLGEEVTVSGTLRDGRIDADEVR